MIRSHPARSPLKDSIASNSKSANPKAIPKKPRITELNIWAKPHKMVIITVLIGLHLLTLESTIKGT